MNIFQYLVMELSRVVIKFGKNKKTPENIQELYYKLNFKHLI
ncbi:hypothetical protein CHRY9293_02741 [Chryseobacterium potabilaquae]|uniref:Uncharacterized protein n=1 Tax=Chryseobacterium potabilaquae TaxID=2675057 RepID=A0A6N4XAP8_9FLAO|nr:hypothetical protein CHRY9293_02741 [Chryseobacterium potabilaquae]